MSTVISKRGQVSIPALIREQMDLREGDRLEWFYDGESLTLVHVPKDPLNALRGSAKGEGLYAALIEERRQERDRD